MKRILIADRNGQLGNRLFLFAHFIAIGMKTGRRVVNPLFDEFSGFFECAFRNHYDGLHVSSRIGPQWFNRLIARFLPGTTGLLFRVAPVTPWYRIVRLYERTDRQIADLRFYDMETEQEFADGARHLIVQGWSFRAFSSVESCRDRIRPLFRLRPEWQAKVDSYRASLSPADITVGIHLRRGDYRTYLGGKYFYPLEVYEQCMRETVRLFPGKTLRFIVCSNEQAMPVAPAACALHAGPGHFIEDLYTLAACDYLIGPPSTFSQWASFYGSVPLCKLESSDQRVESLGDFSVASL
jgi:hypothetical protein